MRATRWHSRNCSGCAAFVWKLCIPPEIHWHSRRVAYSLCLSIGVLPKHSEVHVKAFPLLLFASIRHERPALKCFVWATRRHVCECLICREGHLQDPAQPPNKDQTGDQPKRCPAFIRCDLYPPKKKSPQNGARWADQPVRPADEGSAFCGSAQTGTARDGWVGHLALLQVT
jgi:hypothetical protein